MKTKSRKTLENKPDTRPRGRSADVGLRVCEATVALLAADGAASLTFEAVAERSGVSRRTLYRRWETKARLIAWAMLETLGTEAPYVDTGNLKNDLVSVLTQIDAFLQSPLAACFLQLMLDANSDSYVSAALDEFWSGRFDSCMAVLDRAISRGECPPQIDKEELIECLFGPIYFRRITKRRPVTSRFINTLVRNVLTDKGVGTSTTR